MLSAYYRARLVVACGLAAVVAIGIGGIELKRNLRYVETTGTIVDLNQSCAQGGQGPMRYGDCSEAPEQADRRTLIRLSYRSPADGQQHEAAVRCDTSIDQTPGWSIGDQVDILAHKADPGTIDRRRCTPIESSASA